MRGSQYRPHRSIYYKIERMLVQGLGKPIRTPRPHAYVTIGEAAQLLGITPKTLRCWDRQGILIPALRLGVRRDRRYTRDQINLYVKQTTKVCDQNVQVSPG